MSLVPTLGCGIEPLTRDTIPIHVDNIGQVNGTDAVTIASSTGSHPAAILCGRTVGGDNVPLRVNPQGGLEFTS